MLGRRRRPTETSEPSVTPPWAPPTSTEWGVPTPTNWGPPSSAAWGVGSAGGNRSHTHPTAADSRKDEQRRWKRRRRRRAAFILGGFALAVVASLGSVALLGSSVSHHSLSGDLVLYSAGNEPEPPQPEVAALAPTPTERFVGPPGEYRFIHYNPDSSPVVWDPCQPIHVIVNDAAAPDGGSKALTQAIDIVAKATGLDFVVDSATDELPSDLREPTVGSGADRRWAPVLIAWATEESTLGLRGDVLGYAQPLQATYGTSGIRRIVTGNVALDADDLGEVRNAFGVSAVRSVIVHELAHLVGLDHVSNRSSLMNTSTDFSVLDANEDDRIGLLLAGGGRCFP